MAKSAKKPPMLGKVDLSRRLDRKTYNKKLKKLQLRLSQIQQAYLIRGHSAVVVFEGWDASGKGGTIRRLSAAFDPRSFKVWPIGAPRAYYLERHFLLRFMERLPPIGAISVFDRSWYGRVLVERVERLTSPKRWKAAYGEIADFERMITDDGIKIVKIFFHISPEEQLARFEERVRNPMKRWKLSHEDFRNRMRWDDYSEAIDEMFERTSTRNAPWTVIPGNDKKHARIAAISEIIKRLGDGVDLSPAPLDKNVIAAAGEHFDLDPSLIEDLKGRAE